MRNSNPKGSPELDENLRQAKPRLWRVRRRRHPAQEHLSCPLSLAGEHGKACRPSRVPDTETASARGGATCLLSRELGRDAGVARCPGRERRQRRGQATEQPETTERFHRAGDDMLPRTRPALSITSASKR
jgi:hypothetical protein